MSVLGQRWPRPYALDPGAGGAPASPDYVTGSSQPSLSSELVLGTSVIMKGTLAARPAAGLAGRLYYITDSGIEGLTRDTGVTWTDLDPAWDLVLHKPSTFAPSAHASSHKSGGGDAIKLDELAAPTDITTLDATTSQHGLMKKYPGGTTNFLRSDGTFAAPPSGFGDPMTTRGDIIIRDAANATARLGIGAAGKVLGSDGTDVSWVAAGSGGGSLPHPYAPPASPTAFDDEFTTGSLDAKWTEFLTPASGFSADYDRYGSFACCEGKGTTNNTLAFRQNIAQGAGVALSVTARVAISGIINDGAQYSLFCVGAANTRGGGNHVAPYVYRGGNTTFFGALRDGVPVAAEQQYDHAHSALWVHYQRSAANVVTVWFSTDGISWARKYRATGVTDNADWLIVELSCDNTSKASQSLIDCIRVNWLTLPD